MNRLGLIPEKYWKAHEFCFYLHDQVANIAVEYELSEIADFTIDELYRAAASQGHTLEEDFDYLALLRDTPDLSPAYRHHLSSHLIISLTYDLLNFLFEALRCLEKRKFTVAFALLRKPLKENLLFLAWILADEAEFIAKFEANTYNNLKGVQPEKRIQIFDRAVEMLPMREAFDGETIHDLIYSKELPHGFEIAFQQATHLVTSKGRFLRTEDLSLNFVFEDPSEDANYDFIYSKLPYLLFFVTSVSASAFNRIAEMNEQVYSTFIYKTLAAYDALFGSGKNKIAAQLRSYFGEFLKCSHCKNNVRLTRDNVAHLMVNEHVLCTACGTDSQIPLAWLFEQAGFSVIENADLPNEAEFGGPRKRLTDNV